MPDLQSILDVSRGKVNPSKLVRLESNLENALGISLKEYALVDPIVVRRELVYHLREQGESPGNLQAIEQFYMGVIRRAAVQGIIDAPPEGPWTKAWQSVLDFADVKSLIRALAAWATENRFEPSEITARHLKAWADMARVDAGSLDIAKGILSGWRTQPKMSNSEGGAQLTERLLKKAQCGTVRASE